MTCDGCHEKSGHVDTDRGFLCDGCAASLDRLHDEQREWDS